MNIYIYIYIYIYTVYIVCEYNIYAYCNILIDLLSVEPAGYILFSKSVLSDS